MNFAQNYLASAIFEFRRYKSYGDETFNQLSDHQLHWQPTEEDNSIAIIIKHMGGNMLSRWTNFLTEDGEKTWRNRDEEFEAPPKTRQELLALWEKGWNCLFKALESIDETNINGQVTIRDKAHSIPEAINRQIAHYASHVGQILFLGKMIKGKDWQSLSIPKGQSKAFNQKMFGKNS